MENKCRPPLEYTLANVISGQITELVKSVTEFHPVIDLLKPENENEKLIVQEMKKNEKEFLIATKLYVKMFDRMQKSILEYEIVIRNIWN